MSFKAVFKASQIELNVLTCSYSLYQEVDPTGRPSSITRGGQIQLVVEGNSSSELFEWMCNSFERKDGSIKFFKDDNVAILKELKFKEGYLINFSENFISTTSKPLSITFTVSAKEIILGSGSHINEWV